ncbi:hypothetical protein AVEN_137792-1 [Araneus ventricosus]|uniref:Uncharacterized protein n=1 Tax=Araneus ventricosus TaxID=182803 RepID=A0A4Y2LA23_ARAVE|nr:hypothetical protein AVEN_137792-1 [Araneus ventricosus]
MEKFDPFSGRDIFDSKYRFALDIVMEVRKWLLGLSRWKLPDIRYNLFTDEHKKAIKRYEFSQEENFISAIKKNTNGIFDNNTFTLCLERFKETYKPEQYSELGFVSYCSAIAFLGVYFSEKSGTKFGIDEAIDTIISLLSDILSRGSLGQSSW